MPQYRRKPVTAEQYRTNAWPNGVELIWVHARYTTVYGRREPVAVDRDDLIQVPGVKTTNGFKQLMDGDWIVTDEDGQHLYSDWEFQRLFESVAALPARDGTEGTE